MFSFDGIVLKKIKVKDSKNIVSVFSKEFGKISVWHNESKNKISLDIGNVYNFSSKTENGINKVDSYKVKNIINTEELGFEEINNILKINYYLEKILPSGMILEGIFGDYNDCSIFFENCSDNRKTCQYFTLKLLKALGIAKSPDKSNYSVNFVKIFSVIDIYKINTLMKIEGIKEEDFEEIKVFNENTLNYYIN